MKNIIAFGAVLLGVCVVLGLVFGWIEYRYADDRTTIDVHTGKIEKEVENATERAVDAGRRLVEETGEALESAGKEVRDRDRQPSPRSDP